jgi:hypothetical protein
MRLNEPVARSLTIIYPLTVVGTRHILINRQRMFPDALVEFGVPIVSTFRESTLSLMAMTVYVDGQQDATGDVCLCRRPTRRD